MNNRPGIRLRSVACALLAGALAAAPAGAGNVLRVGSTRTFRTIGAAVAAAQPGDLILVDPESFPPFAVAGKGITIASSALPARFTIVQATGAPALVVSGIPKGQSVTILGFVTSMIHGTTPAVEIRDCPGAVRIQDATIDPVVDLPDAAARGVLEAVNTRTLWFVNLSIWPATPRRGSTRSLIGGPIGANDGLSGIVAQDTGVVLHGFAIRGFDNPGTAPGGRWGGDALRLVGASPAWLLNDVGSAVANQLRGGAGGDYGGNAIHVVQLNPRPEVVGCGPLLLAPGPGSLMPGGFLAINNDRGLIVQGNVTYQRTLPACIFSGIGAVDTRSPFVSPGGSLDVTVSSVFARAFVLFLGTATEFAPRPLIPGMEGKGMLDFHSPSTFPIAAGVLASPPLVSLRFPLPNDKALIGLAVTLQALLGKAQGQAGPDWSLSFAEMLVVVP